MNYIICTRNLSGIGGGQTYCLRRVEYLRKKMNCNILLITGDKKQIKLSNLYNFNILEFEFIDKIILDPLKFDFVLKKIKSNLISGDIYIESHDSFYWMERLAKKLKAKHYIYMLAEIDVKRMEEKELLLKKLENKEVIGITKETLRISFGKLWSNNKYENRYVNIGIKDDEIVKKYNYLKIKTFYSKPANTFRILTISRFDKTYIEELLRATIDISKEYPSIKVELFLVGDSRNKEIKINLETKYRSKDNLTINFLGYINPLFEELFLNSDLYIGMGTTIIDSASLGIPCLVIDPRNNKSSGFFGKDVFSVAYRKDDKTFEILDKIKEFIEMSNLEKEDLKLKTKKLFIEEFEFKKVMEKLDNYIFEKKEKIEYIKIRIPLKGIIKYFLYKINILNGVIKIKNKIFGKNKFVNL